jgi:hypothetical protein
MIWLSSWRRAASSSSVRSGITPLEVQLRTMRALWDEANKGGTLNFELAIQASAVAKDCAPFVHARLSNIEAKLAITGHEAALAELT